MVPPPHSTTPPTSTYITRPTREAVVLGRGVDRTWIALTVRPLSGIDPMLVEWVDARLTWRSVLAGERRREPGWACFRVAAEPVHYWRRAAADRDRPRFRGGVRPRFG